LNILWLVADVCGFLLLLELGLRGFGFGNPLIYIADQEIGYLLAPSQRTRRMGNRLEINEYSMRSPKITSKRPKSTLRVLLLGDSVANGAWWTDQNQTISALIADQLELILGKIANRFSIESVEALNASANSWGPRNELAYLHRFGTFEAQAVVLLINTDDLFATAPNSVPVGRDRNYPNQKPRFAITEVIQRYVLKTPTVPEMQVVNNEKGDRVGFNLEAIRQIDNRSLAADAKFLLVMTPLLREMGKPGSRDYEIQARLRLKQFTQDQQIIYLDLLEEFTNSPTPASLYRDHIHLSPQGNQKVTEAITRSLQFLLPQITSSASTTPTTPQ
jgi:GDSL-like Lipase/Acylhydrolase family